MRVPWRGLSQDGHGPHILPNTNHHLPTFAKALCLHAFCVPTTIPMLTVRRPIFLRGWRKTRHGAETEGPQFSRLAPIPTCKLPPARDLFPHLRRGGTRGSPGGSGEGQIALRDGGSG